MKTQYEVLFQRRLRGCVEVCLDTIRNTSDLNRVTKLLQLCSDLVLYCNTTQKLSHSDKQYLLSFLSENVCQQFEELFDAASALDSVKLFLNQTFYQQLFVQFGTFLLDFVAGKFVAQFSAQEKLNFFDAFFEQGQLIEVLEFLRDYLSQVYRIQQGKQLNGGQLKTVVILPIGAKISIQLFEHIFSLQQTYQQIVKLVENEINSEKLLKIIISIPELSLNFEGDKYQREFFSAKNFVPNILINYQKQQENYQNDEKYFLQFYGDLFERFCQRGWVNECVEQIDQVFTTHNTKQSELILSTLNNFKRSENFEKILLNIFDRVHTHKINFDDFMIFLREYLLNDVQQNKIKIKAVKNIFIHKFVPPMVVEPILKILKQAEILDEILNQLFQIWSSKNFVKQADPKKQAFYTFVLINTLDLIDDIYSQNNKVYLQCIFAGISERLSSPFQFVNFSAFRMAQKFQKITEPEGDLLFGDKGSLELFEEEIWYEQNTSKPKENGTHTEKPELEINSSSSSKNFQNIEQQNQSCQITEQNLKQNQQMCTEFTQNQEQNIQQEYPCTDSDDSDALSLDPYDTNDDEFQKEQALRKNLNLGRFKTPQLRTLADILRKGENVQARLAALEVMEQLIRSRPDELQSLAAEVFRGLLYVQLPNFSKDEVIERDQADIQRGQALISLLATAPQQAGLSAAYEFYSVQLDTDKRLLILDTMESSAFELANMQHLISQKQRQQLSSNLQELSTNNDKNNQNSSNVQKYSVQDKTKNTSNNLEQDKSQNTNSFSQKQSIGNTRVWGHKSLASRKNRTRYFKNNFGQVGLLWCAALLKEIDVVTDTLDLFNRDFFILGRMLQTFGAFVQAAEKTPQISALSSAVVELIRSPKIFNHGQPFVRRAALIVCSQILSVVRPVNIVNQISSHSLSIQQVQDNKLLEQLQWVGQWGAEVSGKDENQECQQIGKIITQLQHNLFSAAIDLLESEQNVANLDFQLKKSQIHLPSEYDFKVHI